MYWHWYTPFILLFFTPRIARSACYDPGGNTLPSDWQACNSSVNRNTCCRNGLLGVEIFVPHLDCVFVRMESQMVSGIKTAVQRKTGLAVPRCVQVGLVESSNPHHCILIWNSDSLKAP
jgi:hypothetical protein